MAATGAQYKNNDDDDNDDDKWGWCGDQDNEARQPPLLMPGNHLTANRQKSTVRAAGAPPQDSSVPGTQKSAPSSTVPASAQDAANRFSAAAAVAVVFVVEHAATGAGRAAAVAGPSAGHAAADAGHAAADAGHAAADAGHAAADAGHAAADAAGPPGAGHAAAVVVGHAATVGAGQAAAASPRFCTLPSSVAASGLYSGLVSCCIKCRTERLSCLDNKSR